MNGMKSIRFQPPVADEMVRAILDGRKTVTRRVMKPQPVIDADRMWQWKDCQWMDGGLGFPASGIEDYAPCCPGDILYVRETFWQSPNGEYTYKSDYNQAEHLTWHPSIHMPREAARIFLRVMGVRVERLQDIDNAGALAEGCDGRCECPQDGALSDCQKSYDFSVEKFQTLWDSTIKPADRILYDWEASPWVWVISFERCRKPEGVE